MNTRSTTIEEEKEEEEESSPEVKAPTRRNKRKNKIKLKNNQKIQRNTYKKGNKWPFIKKKSKKKVGID